MSSTTMATILFTDVVGSTSRPSRLGDDTAEVLRREHFGLLRRAVQRHDGREVKNLGDGLMLVFDGVVAALDCAAAMQQAIESRNPGAGAGDPLTIRVGISAGECDVDDDDYFGTPVIEAARLCAEADGGQVLVGEMARLLVGTRGGFDLEPVGSRLLKGLPAPVDVFELRWAPLPEATVAIGSMGLPPRLEVVGPFGFFGRREARELLDTSWKEVTAGGRRIVLVSGEPGVGKTALVAAVARRAHDDGAIVVYGRCDEDLGIPYQPWVEVIGYLAEHLPDQVRTRAGGQITELGMLATAFQDRGLAEPGGDLEGERLNLFAAVAALLRQLGEEQPVFVVLDDLQWADRPTLALLRHLLNASNAGRLMVAGTFRDSEVDDQHPLADLLAALHRNDEADRVALAGLGDDELVAMLQLAAGHALPDEGVELAHALGRETNGNPFFTIEIVRHLAETGAISRDDAGHWRGEEALIERGLPVSVREVIGRRVARLGEETIRVLTGASVIGREFDLQLLAEVVDLSEDATLDLLEGALAADLIADVAPGRFGFVHALVEHTLYSSLRPTRRARLHRRVAEVIEEHGVEGRLAELAYHWGEATTAQDIGKAFEYALARRRPCGPVVGSGRRLPVVRAGSRDARRPRPRPRRALRPAALAR